MDLQSAIRSAANRIADAGNTDPTGARLDAEVLLTEVLRRPRSYLYAFSERLLSTEQWAVFEGLVTRRVAGEPVAHLLGHREFWSMSLAVNRHTLIPRPDTETLVEAALVRLADLNCDAPQVLDLGTGTGAVALAIAQERRDAQVLATDVLEDVVELAEENRRRVSIPNVTVKLSDWFGAITGRYHIIVSNPPYLEENDPHLQEGDLRYEPKSALVSGADGLDAIRHIVNRAPEFLLPGGWLLLEHGWTQGPAVRAALTTAGFDAVVTERDLAGRERVSAGRRRASGYEVSERL